LLNYTRIENAHKVLEKTFVYYVAVIRTTTEGTDRDAGAAEGPVGTVKELMRNGNL